MSALESDTSQPDLKEYIRHLFQSHAVDVENLSVWEMAEDFFGYNLTDEQFDQVFKLMGKSRVDVIVGWDDE